MPSPFPGMDPFIEGHSWRDFHRRFVNAVIDSLTPAVRPRYVVRGEERVYLEHTPENGSSPFFAPDVFVVDTRDDRAPAGAGGGTATAVVEIPTILAVPMPVEEKEHFITILWRETLEVVTVVEMLSPGNKRRGSDGRKEYLTKRETLLLSSTHLVELDLLRGGARLPTIQPLPKADYYAFVSRARRRPNIEAYHWPLLHRMPAIPIPLKEGDPDVTLDLQAVFDTVYDRSDYDYSLDYTRSLDPPLSETDASQIRDILHGRG